MKMFTFFHVFSDLTCLFLLNHNELVIKVSLLERLLEETGSRLSSPRSLLNRIGL